SGWDDYRRLLRDLEAAVGGLPQLPVASNGMTAQAIIGAQFRAAFAVDRVSEPSRPAPPPRPVPAPVAAAVPVAAPAVLGSAIAGGEPVYDRPIFVVAPPRSGSTMLFETLAENRELWTVG